MPIAFTCPHCGLKTEVAEEFAGHTGPCAGCGKSVTVAPLVGAPGHGSGGGAAVAVVAVVVVVVLLLIGIFVCGGALFWVRAARGRAPVPAPAASATTAAVAEQPDQCAANLRRIGLAMQAYHTEHGRFPPAYLTDKDGKPAHSWRVLLLPYLGHKDWYQQYRFDEPWDSPNNSDVCQLMESLYQHSGDIEMMGAPTSYVMIVGPGTISDGPTGTRLEDIKDGASNTILVVETRRHDIECAEPRDLRAEQIDFQVQRPDEPALDLQIDFQVKRGSGGIGSEHPQGAHVLLCDGTVRLLPHGTDPQVVRAMSTIAGGETVTLPGELCPVGPPPAWDPYSREPVPAPAMDPDEPYKRPPPDP